MQSYLSFGCVVFVAGLLGTNPAAADELKCTWPDKQSLDAMMLNGQHIDVDGNTLETWPTWSYSKSSSYGTESFQIKKHVNNTAFYFQVVVLGNKNQPYFVQGGRAFWPSTSVATLSNAEIDRIVEEKDICRQKYQAELDKAAEERKAALLRAWRQQEAEFHERAKIPKQVGDTVCGTAFGKVFRIGSVERIANGKVQVRIDTNDDNQKLQWFSGSEVAVCD